VTASIKVSSVLHRMAKHQEASSGMRRTSVVVQHVVAREDKMQRESFEGLSSVGVASEPAAELKAVRRQGHSVPGKFKEAGSAVQFFENNARRLSHAEKACTLLVAQSNGTLSTLHHETGWPYGSVVNFSVEDRKSCGMGSRVLIFVSRLAEHTANLSKDPRASLLVSTTQGTGDRLATTRATFLVHAHRVEKTKGAKSSFLKAHPNAHYVHFDDFDCFELQVNSVRYIGGFGEMSWVDGASFSEADPDPIAADAETAQAAVDHCNADHADAVLEMARAFSGLNAAQGATMLSVDRYGFDVLCQMPDGLRRSRVQFSRKLDQGDSLRHAMSETTKQARELLRK